MALQDRAIAEAIVVGGVRSEQGSKERSDSFAREDVVEDVVDVAMRPGAGTHLMSEDSSGSSVLDEERRPQIRRPFGCACLSEDKLEKFRPTVPVAVMGGPPAICTRGAATQQVDLVVAKVAAHYGVEACVLALHDDTSATGVRIIAQRGLASLDLSARREDPEFRFFRHHVRRKLPIIFEDTVEAVNASRDDPSVPKQPRVRFYASAPLVQRGKYTGTLSIVDFAPHPEFNLKSCDVLVSMALKAVDAVDAFVSQTTP